jgi:hypothetical protein
MGLHFFYEKENENHQLPTGNFVHHRITAGKIGGFVNVRMLHTVLRSGWRNTIFLNMHSPSEKKSDDSKDRFYEEFGQVFDHFPKYHITFLNTIV